MGIVTFGVSGISVSRNGYRVETPLMKGESGSMIEKRSRKHLLVVVAVALFLAPQAIAQGKNEIGLLIGGTFVPSLSSIDIKSGLAYEATFAHKFIALPGVGFGFEVPFVAVPSQDVQSASIFSPRNYASLFITPGVRLTLAPSALISPWASIGGGYARFSESTTLVTGAPNPFTRGTNKGALQYGGGADFKLPLGIPLPIALRAEVRDFFSGQPRLNVSRSGNGQHNVFVAGGLVLHF